MKTSELNELIDLIVEATLKESPGQQTGRLRDIFLNPARDVVKTAGYAAEKISSSVQGLVKGLAYIIPTIIIPGLEFDYDLFAKDEQAKLDAIKKKYGDVLQRNWEAIKDPDVFGFLFLAYPQSMLGYALMKRSPLAFLQILEVVTGGMADVRRARERLESTSAYSARQTQHGDSAANSWGGGQGNDFSGGGDGNTGWGMGESILREEADPQTLQRLQQLMGLPQVQQAIAASPMFKDMAQTSVQIMTAPAARFMQFQNLEQMKSMVNPQIIDKAIQAIQSKPEYQQADAQTKQNVVNDFVAQTKATYKQQYVKWLQGLISKSPNAAPRIQQAITQINAMK